MRTELLLVGVGHQFDADSDVCRDLTRVVRAYRPQVVGVEVPPPEHFLGFAEQHSAPLLVKAAQADVAQPPRTVADTQNRRGIEHFARGEYAEAVQCFRRALTADPQHADASANRALAFRSCRGSEEEHVLLPLQDELGYRVVAVGGTRARHFRARTEAREALASDPVRRQRWEAYRAFCDVIWGRVIVPRYQSLAGMNSEASHALHEVTHEAISALFGDDALDLCWAEQNQLACASIGQLVEENPGARLLVVYGCEHLYALIAWAVAAPGVRLVRLSEVAALG